MADLPTRQVFPAEIVLTLAGDRPIAVDELARLFRALAKDYAKTTRGRTLVIAGIRNGSLITDLTDAYFAIAPYLKNAIEVAGATTALAGFAKILKDATDRFRHAGKPSAKQKQAGDSSAIEIFRIASQTGKSVDFRHENADGEVIEVHVGADEAREARSIKSKLLPGEEPPMLSDLQSLLSLEDLRSKSPEQIADAILTIGSLGGPTVRDTVQKMIETVKSAFLGRRVVLAEIATRLKRGGRGDLAHLLDVAPPMQEPPLLV